jgi:hypothetical protein
MIAGLGLFALAAFMAEKRTKEISIRKVLGASTGTILKMLTGQFFTLLVLAILFAIPIGYFFMQNWLRDFGGSPDLIWYLRHSQLALIGFNTCDGSGGLLLIQQNKLPSLQPNGSTTMEDH